MTERKRSEAALIQVVQEAFVQGVFTRKMEKLAQRLGIENLSRSQVSEMTKGLNEQVSEFRHRPLSGTTYPVLWVDALYEKVRVDGRIVSMAALKVYFMRICTSEREAIFCCCAQGNLADTYHRACQKAGFDVMDTYGKCFPKAVQWLENSLEDSLTFYAFPKLDARKIILSYD